MNHGTIAADFDGSNHMSRERTRANLPKIVRDRLVKIFATANENEVVEMIWAVCDAVDEGLARQLKTPSSALILARIRGIAAREKLKKEEGGHISLAAAAKRLAISRSEMLSQYHSGRIVGWLDGKQVRVPIWQFSRTGLLPGLQTILEALRQTSWNDDWARMLFFLGALESLGDKRPLDLLREGRIKEILPLATRWED